MTIQEASGPKTANQSDSLQTLLVQAREAEARYDHETAVAAYAAALDLPDLTLEEQYEMLEGRAFAFYNWGIQDKAEVEARNVIDLARQSGDTRRLAEAIAIHGYFWRVRGVDDPPRQLIEEGLLLADELDDDRFRGYCWLVLATQAWTGGDPDKAWKYLNSALEAARRSGDDDILFEAIRLHAYSHDVYGRTDEALRLLGELNDLATKSGSELKRYSTMLLYGNTVRDLAAKRDFYEQALNAETAASFRAGASTNPLAMLFWRLGLYNRAQNYAAEALDRAEASGSLYRLGRVLDTYGRILSAKGLLKESAEALHKVTENPKFSFYNKASSAIGLAEIALARGRPSEAADLFRRAPELHNSVEPVALAGLGAAYLAMNQIDEALSYSSRNTAFLEAGKTSDEFHEQGIWWRRYQVLKAAGREEAFSALDSARQTMLVAIETLSDEGLRRNYLNEVALNRDITLTWTAEAHKRGIPLDPFTKHEPLAGNLRAQFRRVTDIGARLTAQHNPETLARFIVDEFVEMSGAERVLLIRDEESEPAITATHNPEDAAELAAPLLEKMRNSRQPVLEQDACEAPEGEVPELHQRSIVALPLVASDRFLGILYGDMRQIFGRFNEADVQLLGMLANQAAAALENAELVSTLEDRVAQRTAELNARVNELAIINTVQEGLVAELNLQAIFEIVGEKLTDIYKGDTISLFTYDAQTDTARARYMVENGQKIDWEPRPPGPMGRNLINNRRPRLLSSRSELDKAGAVTHEGTLPAFSTMSVPLLVGDRFIGSLNVDNLRQEEAYDEDDLRLLSTLASGMSVALENARLFDEARNARTEAESANEAKSAFMSNMSHELRTPLNAILGFTRIVKRKTTGQIPERQTDNLGKVLSSGEHLLGLINTVLDIAKIEAGRMDVINSRFHAGRLIEATATVARPLLKPGVDLHLEVAPGLPEINSDQDKIKQILLNLLSNAAKFTHEGSIIVSANVGAVREPPIAARPERRHLAGSEESTLNAGDSFFINVTDTGIGMNEAALGRVFEEFQQADAATRKQYGGTGLGMPISKHLAQLLGGDLTVTSTAGEGSTFTLTLPIE